MRGDGWSLVALALIAIEVALLGFIYVIGVMGGSSEWQLTSILLSITAPIPVLYFLLGYGVLSPEVRRKKDGVTAAVICFLVNGLVFSILFVAIMSSEQSGESWVPGNSQVPGILVLCGSLLTQLISGASLRHWINRYSNER